MTHLREVQQYGQSIWLNYLRRAFIDSGQLREILDEGIGGITSSPAIFEKAITDSCDYDMAIRELVGQGMPVKEIYQALVLDDIQRAADVLHTVFEETGGRDGYVTMELDPALAHDAVGTVAEARHLLAVVNRSNVMIEIPATAAGVEAIEILTRDGVSVNATHVFSLDTYEQVANAFIRGMEEYVETSGIWRKFPASVVSISLSRIDSAVDRALVGLGRTEYQGMAGITLAKVAYSCYQQMFKNPDWEKLEQRGPHGQRLKWTRITPRDFDYPDTLYVDALIGPDTVATLSPATLNAFRDHGIASNSLTQDLEVAQAHLTTLAELGVDLNAIGQDLQAESLAAFDVYFQALIKSVGVKRDKLENDWRRMTWQIGRHQAATDNALEELAGDRIMSRIWDHDHTVWNPEPQEITNRLGWLHIDGIMKENLHRLGEFASSIHASGFKSVLLLGMGGASLAAELFAKTFGPGIRLGKPLQPHLQLSVLDTTDPDAIRTRANRLDLSRTLFIVASKSGTTVETMSAFNYFYNKVADVQGMEMAGGHFVAITDPGTPLATLAGDHGFRDLFLNDPNIGGKYSALSYFGLLPAALVGVELDVLLDRAMAMACNSHSCNRPLEADNLAAQLGAVLSEMAVAGRDKLTFVTSPSIALFADWCKQLIAGSTGKGGVGIVPVVGESLGNSDVYGDDRLFIHLRLEGDDTNDEAIFALENAVQPIVTIRLKDVYDLGGCFFLWEMATAVACHRLNVQPFNQPEVEEAKRLAREIVTQYEEWRALPAANYAPTTAQSLDSFLSGARPGDYIALQAFVPPTPATTAALTALRTRLRDQYRLATMLGYGPSYLHASGQLHKGDRGNGLFIQFTSDPADDIPITDESGRWETPLTFGALKMAQAIGDARALAAGNRRLIRFHLGRDVVSELNGLVGT
jgi:transaldolase/glucose-6-phosphate isomerase